MLIQSVVLEDKECLFLSGYLIGIFVIDTDFCCFFAIPEEKLISTAVCARVSSIRGPRLSQR